MNDNKKNIILNTKQVSEYLRIPLRTIQHLSRIGKIKSVKIGKHWRYHKSDIEQYFNVNTGFSQSFRTNFSIEPTRKQNTFVERREYPRTNCSLPCYIDLDVHNETKINSIGVISNISEGGVFINNLWDDNISIDLKNNNIIDLRFKLSENSILKVDCKVIRLQNKGIAVRFSKLDLNAIRQIRGYVE